MKIKEGMRLEKIFLKEINGLDFDSSSLKGKRVLLSFYRFASCPLCNLRVYEFSKRYDELGDNFIKIAVFDSSLENLKAQTSKHKAPFPILADEDLSYYKKYEVEKSFFKFLLSQLTRGPRLMKAMLMGFIPFPIKGSLTRLPLDVLISEDGLVRRVKYAKDIGDHFSFDEVKDFALNKS